MGVPSQEISLTNIKRLGFSSKFCIDIGAYEGYWTVDFKKIFPGCAITMIEGQSLKEPALIKIKKIYNDVNYKIELLGATKAAVKFNIYESASSVLVEYFDTEAKTEQRNLLTLEERGFVLYDICTLMKRPLDNALFQSDFLFVKEDSQFRNNKHWA